MSDDLLSRDLTEVLRGVEGVVDVFDAHPVVEGAVRAVAAGLDLAGSTGLVEISRAAGSVSVTAHVATALDSPTPETLARAADALRGRLAASGLAGDGVVVSVSARLVDAPR
ncbi:hypothetical protein [Frigoribacterium sp. Leaf44]|jgi:hypothetical protein|uniref:hypothetical protein n=1 Tax=Frigoribacterium sp. Leaf44 TaxID=1736220 RepID=UPI0007002225|nr:hypothetical protein [Frigoribacterium sp. Leaf44]KQN42462.1 hypothetical protein ASE87_08165 [Frigoribacterium sp. Leaf44]